jgi:hypothetical protein
MTSIKVNIFYRHEIMSIHQGETMRVEFEVPLIYNQNLHSNTLVTTGVSLEMNLLLGEPSLWQEYKGFF